MVVIPPDNSLVVIKSCRFGTYLTACADQESVRLQKVDEPNMFPPNYLWTIQTKLLLGPVGSLRFVSCHGKYLSRRGFFSFEIGQDYPINTYTRFSFAAWTYDRLGSVVGQEGFRLMLNTSMWFLRARGNGEVSLELNLLFANTAPEYLWVIHPIKSPSSNPLHIPRCPLPALPSTDDGKPDKFYSPLVVVNSYSTANACNSGGNINESGTQYTGAVKVNNDKSVGKNKVEASKD